MTTNMGRTPKLELHTAINLTGETAAAWQKACMWSSAESTVKDEVRATQAATRQVKDTLFGTHSQSSGPPAVKMHTAPVPHSPLCSRHFSELTPGASQGSRVFGEVSPNMDAHSNPKAFRAPSASHSLRNFGER